MKRLGDLLTRHRNLFLLLLLLCTLAVSSAANRERLAEASATVHIPVTSAPTGVSRVETFRQARDEAYRADLAALEALCTQTDLDERTRTDAAARMQQLIDCRQAETALEGALLGSSLSPCVAVVAGGNVTIVTGKSAVTKADSALVLSLAKAHADAAPECVRIITAE